MYGRVLLSVEGPTSKSVNHAIMIKYSGNKILLCINGFCMRCS